MASSKGFRQGSLFGIGVTTKLNLPLSPEFADPLITIKKGRISRPHTPPIYQKDKISVYKEPGGDVTIALAESLLKISSRELVIDCDDSIGLDLQILFAWPLLLSLLGRESLHGCVVAKGDEGLAILGATGSGKSTTALRLVELGFKMVTDDLVVFNDDFRAVPGPPFIRLRPDQATDLKGEWDNGGKFRCIVPASDAAVAIRKIVILDKEFSEIEPIRGAKAVDLIVRYLASSYVLFPDQGKNRFKIATSVANRIQIYGARPRSLNPSQLAAVSDSIANDLELCRA